MLTEHDVIDAVCQHLVEHGYHVTQRLAVTEKGIDIIARHAKRGSEVRIEAKGGTSATEGSARHGKPFKTVQVFTRVTDAFYMAAKMRSQCPDPAVIVGMAFADLPQYRAYMNAIAPVIRQLQFTVMFVDAARSVTYWDTASERSVCRGHNR